MDVVIEKLETPETLDDLKALLKRLRVDNGANDDEIAEALDQLKIEPRGWTAYRVRCLVKSLKVYRKWGRKTAAEEAARFIEKNGRPEVKSKPRRTRRPKPTPLPTEYEIDDCTTAYTYSEAR